MRNEGEMYEWLEEILIPNVYAHVVWLVAVVGSTVLTM